MERKRETLDPKSHKNKIASINKHNEVNTRQRKVDLMKDNDIEITKIQDPPCIF